MNDGVTIERVFNSTPEKVFKAFTDPAVVKEWWGPEGFTAPSAKADFKVGGKYIYAMKGPDGSEWDAVAYSAGVYKEIVPNEKIVVTDFFSDSEGNMIDPTDAGMDPNFPKESTVEIRFEPVDGGKTKLTIHYPKPESDAQLQAMIASGMEQGWQSSLNKLAKIVE